MQEPQTVAVVGADLGHAIARAAAAAGYRVRLHDPSPEALARAAEGIRRALEGEVIAHARTVNEWQAALDNLFFTTELDEALLHADLVVEAAEGAERPALLRQVGESCRASATLATIAPEPLAAVAGAVPQPGRVVGLRFQPGGPELREIVVGPETAPHALASARAFAERLGARPALRREEPPG